MNNTEKELKVANNGGIRSGIDRRKCLDTNFFPERRSGRDRRKGFDRRSPIARRKGSERRVRINSSINNLRIKASDLRRTV